jgi:uncharacterized CHY-type Zn-finger protein
MDKIDKNDKPIFEITHANIFAVSMYNIKGSCDCTICKQNLNSNSIGYEEEGKTSEIVNGLCSHSFHAECIETWIKENKDCPICRKPWAKIVNSNKNTQTQENSWEDIEWH